MGTDKTLVTKPHNTGAGLSMVETDPGEKIKLNPFFFTDKHSD
jgi:hypothetical protein